MEPKYKVGDWIKWSDRYIGKAGYQISQITEVEFPPPSGGNILYRVESGPLGYYPVLLSEIAGTPTRRQIIHSVHEKGLIKSPTKNEFAIWLLEN